MTLDEDQYDLLYDIINDRATRVLGDLSQDWVGWTTSKRGQEIAAHVLRDVETGRTRS